MPTAYNKTDLFHAYASHPFKARKYSPYQYCNTGYRLTVDESGVLRSYDLPIAGVNQLTDRTLTRAFYVHYRNSTPTTNRHIDGVYHAIRQHLRSTDTVQDRLFYVDTVPTAGAKVLDQDRHEHNAKVVNKHLEHNLKLISKPRLRIKTRVAAWRDALFEWQRLVDYAQFHVSMFPDSTVLRTLAKTPMPELTDHFTPKQLAIAALEGHDL